MDTCRLLQARNQKMGMIRCYTTECGAAHICEMWVREASLLIPMAMDRRRFPAATFIAAYAT